MPEREEGRFVDEGDREGWIVTYTNKRFYPLDPRIDDIDIIDIAHALSNMPRYTGHTKQFYSVAQHSYLVSIFSVPHALFGLLHDASEAYLCDIPTPVKYSEVFAAYRKIEEYLQSMILLRYGFRDPTMPKTVKTADTVVGIIEGLNQMPEHEGAFWTDYKSNGNGFHPEVISLKPWTPEESERLFLWRWNELVPRRFRVPMFIK